MQQLPVTSNTVSGGVARDVNDSGVIVGSLELEENKWSRQLGVPHAVAAVVPRAVEGALARFHQSVMINSVRILYDAVVQ